MNILILVDKNKSAIDRLAQPIKEHNPHLNIRIEPLHPKRPSAEQLEAVTEAWEWADLVHVSYWKSGAKFKELYPEWWTKKPKILWHHNPYDIDKENWTDDYLKVVVHNSTIHAMIPYARLIPQCIDLDFYKFNNDYTEEKVVSMVVARIEGKKGAREVAQVCKELGYKFVLVGRISKQEYFNQIMEVNPDTVFKENISDEELLQTYCESAIHVCNSADDFESGTLPILESMAVGVPVLTRNIGHVPDLFNGDNMVVRMGEQGDTEELKKELKDLMENKQQRLKIREKAWNTVKNRPAEKMARQFANLYYDALRVDNPFISVIVPTFDKPEILVDNLICTTAQDYPFFEVIVVDSGDVSSKPIVDEVRKRVGVPIKYIRFKNNGEYTLPKARNLAVIESQGHFICLCDERIGMAPNALSTFVGNIGDKFWLYGVKDGYAKGFVENFSFVERELLVRHGMFNERIDCYGGASQEIRERYAKYGVMFNRVDTAHAKSLAKSNQKWRRKPEVVRAKQILWKLYGSK